MRAVAETERGIKMSAGEDNMFCVCRRQPSAFIQKKNGKSIMPSSKRKLTRVQVRLRLPFVPIQKMGR